MRDSHVNVLYTTAPPFSDHLVGLVLRIRRRFTWIAEFRDPWSDNPWKPWFVRSRATDSIERWLENRCLLSSDGVVTVTRAYADTLVARHGVRLATKLLVVRNGVPAVSPVTATDPATFRIVYAGSFYHGRNPKPFLAAVAELHREAAATARRLDVRFVGDCRQFDGESLASEVERLGLPTVVTFVDWLPHEESVTLMREADLLLLLAQNQPLQVPNKLYEYLGTGRRIFAVADENGETARLLRETGGHFVVSPSDTPEVMAHVLAQAVAAAGSPRQTSSDLTTLTTESQMRALTDWLDRMDGKR